MNQSTMEELYKKRCRALKDSTYKINKYLYYQTLNNYDNFRDILREEEFNQITRNKKNRSAKRYRANKKMIPIKDAINLDDKRYSVFGTFTFKEEMFYKKNGAATTERTRTKKVNEEIKKLFDYAIANIDYGSKNEREHHHVSGILKSGLELELIIDKKTGELILSKTGRPQYKILGYDEPLGFTGFELIELNYEDLKYKKVSNYLVKINNHSNKVTSKNRRLRVFNNS